MEIFIEEKRSFSFFEFDKRSSFFIEDNKEFVFFILEEIKMIEDVEMIDIIKDGKFMDVFIEWCNIDKII